MLETGLALGMIATHIGVPLADLAAWALVFALLAAPVPLDVARRQRLMKAVEQQDAETDGAELPSLVMHSQSDNVREAVVVKPATIRLSAADQWQAVSRLVSSGAERAMAVARDQQAIRRELDSLDFTLENLRRELAAVMILPAVGAAELVPVRVRQHSRALAA